MSSYPKYLSPNAVVMFLGGWPQHFPFNFVFVFVLYYIRLIYLKYTFEKNPETELLYGDTRQAIILFKVIEGSNWLIISFSITLSQLGSSFSSAPSFAKGNCISQNVRKRCSRTAPQMIDWNDDYCSISIMCTPNACLKHESILQQRQRAIDLLHAWAAEWSWNVSAFPRVSSLHSQSHTPNVSLEKRTWICSCAAWGFEN